MRSAGAATRATLDELERAIAFLDIDHGGQKLAYRLARLGTQPRKRPCNPRGLQPGEPHRQGRPFRSGIEKPLTPILWASPLLDIPFVQKLLEHASKRLFRDLQNVEEVSNLDPGIAIDEMQNSVMCPAELQCGENVIGVTHEISVRKEQELDNVPYRLAGPHRILNQLGPWGRERIYVSHVDIF
jgi:hypothetical protein